MLSFSKVRLSYFIRVNQVHSQHKETEFMARDINLLRPVSQDGPKQVTVWGPKLRGFLVSATPILCRRSPGKRKENSIVVQSKIYCCQT